MSKGLDKNGIIGLVLIGAILLIFSYLTQPTEEELAAKAKKDKAAKQTEQIDKSNAEEVISPAENKEDTTAENTILPLDSTGLTTNTDSLSNLQYQLEYGPFANAASGEE